MSRAECLDAAYRATTYRAAIPGGTGELRIGAPAPELDRLLDAQGESCWAYLTAVNPGSRRLADADNAGRAAGLEARIAALGFVFFRGEAVADAGDWPPEPSLLVIGLGRESAAAIACEFGQNAFVCGERGGVATLVWTMSPGP